MKTKLYIFLVVLIWSFSAKAQNAIVLQGGDMVYCAITEIQEERLVAKVNGQVLWYSLGLVDAYYFQGKWTKPEVNPNSMSPLAHPEPRVPASSFNAGTVKLDKDFSTLLTGAGDAILIGVLGSVLLSAAGAVIDDNEVSPYLYVASGLTFTVGLTVAGIKLGRAGSYHKVHR